MEPEHQRRDDQRSPFVLGQRRFVASERFDPLRFHAIRHDVVWRRENSDGEVYSINTDGSDFTVLYSFTGNTDGEDPVGNLALSGSTLYGVTDLRGPANLGTVFAVTTSGLLAGDFDFSASDSILRLDHAGPTLIGSTLYGTTWDGGFDFDDPSNIFALSLPTAGPGGAIQYTVTVTNNGPSEADGVSIADPLASNSSLTAGNYRASETGGGTGFSTSGTGSIDDIVDLPPGATITYTITADISASAAGMLLICHRLDRLGRN